MENHLENFVLYDVCRREDHLMLTRLRQQYVFLDIGVKIDEIGLCDERILVVYSVYQRQDLMGYERYRNIWCFHKDGKLLWRIQQDAEDKKYCDIYSGVFIERDTGKLKAATGFGMVYDLDIETGAVSNPDFRK